MQNKTYKITTPTTTTTVIYQLWAMQNSRNSFAGIKITKEKRVKNAYNKWECTRYRSRWRTDLVCRTKPNSLKSLSTQTQMSRLTFLHKISCICSWHAHPTISPDIFSCCWFCVMQKKNVWLVNDDGWMVEVLVVSSSLLCLLALI